VKSQKNEAEAFIAFIESHSKNLVITELKASVRKEIPFQFKAATPPVEQKLAELAKSESAVSAKQSRSASVSKQSSSVNFEETPVTSKPVSRASSVLMRNPSGKDIVGLDSSASRSSVSKPNTSDSLKGRTSVVKPFSTRASIVNLEAAESARSSVAKPDTAKSTRASIINLEAAKSARGSVVNLEEARSTRASIVKLGATKSTRASAVELNSANAEDRASIAKPDPAEVSEQRESVSKPDTSNSANAVEIAQELKPESVSPELDGNGADAPIEQDAVAHTEPAGQGLQEEDVVEPETSAPFEEAKPELALQQEASLAKDEEVVESAPEPEEEQMKPEAAHDEPINDEEVEQPQLEQHLETVDPAEVALEGENKEEEGAE